MSYKNIVEKIFEKGSSEFSDMESYIESSSSMELTVLEGEISNYSLSTTEGLSFRGLRDNRMGYSYTEKIDETSVDLLINDAMENGEIMGSEDREIIFEGVENYREFEKEERQLDTVSVDSKAELLKDIEKAALNFSDKIVNVNYCSYEEFTNNQYIYNTKGLDLFNEEGLAYVYLSVVAQDGQDIKTGSNLVMARNFKDFNSKDIADLACREAISLLGADSIESGKYDVIIKNKTFTSLMQAFLSVFIADNVQKDMSLMKGKIGEKIGSGNLNFKEDPFLKDGIRSRSFDDEGSPTSQKYLVKDGVLETYLYNWKSALKDKRESTGNGFRTSYKSSAGTSYTNLIIEPGQKDFKELLQDLDEGLYITDIQGLHSGLNAVSGDFSLSASGYEVKEGKIYRPVNQITIAGNLVDLLMNIKSFANDFHMSISSIGSASVLVGDILVSGK